MTSSDVLDTSFNIQLVQSGKIILKDIDQILKVLKKQAKNINLLRVWEEVMEYMLNQLLLDKISIFLRRI